MSETNRALVEFARPLPGAFDDSALHELAAGSRDRDRGSRRQGLHDRRDRRAGWGQRRNVVCLPHRRRESDRAAR